MSYLLPMPLMHLLYPGVLHGHASSLWSSYYFVSVSLLPMELQLLLRLSDQGGTKHVANCAYTPSAHLHALSAVTCCN